MPLALVAQGTRPGLTWVWFEGEEFPLGVRGQSLVLARCYAADSRPEPARRSTETGKYPHTVMDGDATIRSTAKDAGIAYTELNLKSGESAASILEAARNAVVVFTREGEEKFPTASERSIHVPVAIFYPALLTPRVVDDVLVSQVDLMPTIASLCGFEPPPEIQGRNLAPLLEGKGGEEPDSVFIEGTAWRVVIRGYEKLVTDLAGTPLHLYNLAADPGEQNDLVRDPGSRLTRDGLAALAQVWMKRLGDGLDPSGLKRR
jgi:arylsulfatase A-like enzyme